MGKIITPFSRDTPNVNPGIPDMSIMCHASGQHDLVKTPLGPDGKVPKYINAEIMVPGSPSSQLVMFVLHHVHDGKIWYFQQGNDIIQFLKEKERMAAYEANRAKVAAEEGTDGPGEGSAELSH